MQHDAVAQIHLPRFRSNLAALVDAAGPHTEVCVTVKADAYGHGLAVLMPPLLDSPIRTIAVGRLSEALEARRLGWDRSILCLGQPLAVASPGERAERATACVESNVTLTLAEPEDAALLNAVAIRLGRIAEVQVKVDTGMGRLGVAPDAARRLVELVDSLPGLRLVGLYSHLAMAEEPHADLTRRQCVVFEQAAQAALAGRTSHVPLHLGNSAAFVTSPDLRMDLVRVGLVAYGYRLRRHWSLPGSIRPILRLVSHVAMVKDLPPGATVGYGATFVTRRPTRLGVVPVGYDDGYLRGLSNRAVMTVPGGLAPVVGAVSMDLTTIDLTDLPRVRRGDPVIVIDADPAAPNSVEALAELLGTVPYEITCLLGQRVARVGVDSFDVYSEADGGGPCP